MNRYLNKNFNISDATFKSNYKSDLFNLKGVIKIMKQVNYFINRDTNELELDNGSASFSFEFNRENEIIRELSTQERYETIYKNFKEGKILSIRHCPDNSFELYEYDEVTDLSNKYIIITADGAKREYLRSIEILDDKSINYYDDNFRIQYDEEGKITHNKVSSNFEYVYDYSTIGKKRYYTKISKHNNEISTLEKYSYDDYIFEVVMYKDNLVTNKKMMFYDETNKLVQRITFHNDDSFENHYYFYNDKNLLIEDKISYPGRKTGTCDFFEYDTNDNVIKTRDNTYQYQYDKYGNWIEKLEYSGNLVIRKIIREFEYHLPSLNIV